MGCISGENVRTAAAAAAVAVADFYFDYCSLNLLKSYY
jgi:hypothetical protein